MVRVGLSFLLLRLVVDIIRWRLSPAFITVGYKVVITGHTRQSVSVPLIKLTHILVITVHLPRLLDLAVIDFARGFVWGTGLVVSVRVGDSYAQLLVVLPDGGVELPLARLRVLEPALVLVSTTLVILVGVVPAVSEVGVKQLQSETTGVYALFLSEELHWDNEEITPDL